LTAAIRFEAASRGVLAEGPAKRAVLERAAKAPYDVWAKPEFRFADPPAAKSKSQRLEC
jgi:hypothetical protein